MFLKAFPCLTLQSSVSLSANYVACAMLGQSFSVQFLRPPLILSLPAIATYEYVFMLNNERIIVWKRRRTAATWFFIFNRYLMIVIATVHFAPYRNQASDVSPK